MGRGEVVDQALLSDNAETMRRLEALVARLSDDDLRRDLGEGWTVAVALAHAGFWDQRAVYGLRRWAREGTPITDADDHILNEALFDEWRGGAGGGGAAARGGGGGGG